MKKTVLAITKINILVIAFFTFSDCISGSKRIVNIPDDVRAIRITSSAPVMGPEGKILKRQDTIDIFYYQDMVMYKTPITRIYSNTTIDTNGHIVKEGLEKFIVDHNYIVRRKAGSFGIKYDSIKADSGRAINVDSFLSGKWISQVGRFVGKIQASDSLVYSRLENDILVEKYIRRKKVDSTYADSAILSYSGGLKDISYSFSEKMDSLKQMKLFRIHMIYNKKPPANSGYQDSDFRFELEEMLVVQPEQFVALFEKFRQKLALRH